MNELWPRVRLNITWSRRFLLLLSASLAVTGCSSGGAPTTSAPAALRVVATTTVIADLVAHVAGERATVTSVVPKGGEVHTFDPSPRDVDAIAGADAIFMNGLGLDEWLGDLARTAGAEGTPLIELAEDLPGVTYLEGEEHEGEEHKGEEHEGEEHEGEEHKGEEHEGEEHEGEEHKGEEHEGEESAALLRAEPAHGTNPHLWLNVDYARLYLPRIRDGLTRADPAGSESYAANMTAYDQRLQELDRWVHSRIDTIPPDDRKIVSFHEAFPYFAEAYGLEVVGVAVEAPGQEPSAADVARLIEAIRANDVRAIFSEVQFPRDLVDRVAAETSAVVESDLYNDSLGDPPVDTYEGLIRWDVERIVAALE